MNQSELGALLALTMPQATVRAQTSTSELCGPLSPKQQFQSQIRRHFETEPGNRSFHHGENRLRRVPNLRAQRHYSPSASPNIHPEPDFIIEEREAWSRRSPDCGVSATEQDCEDEIMQLAVTLQPPQESTERPPQPQKLRPLEPLENAVNINQRPKTSRGPRSLVQIHEDNVDGLDEGSIPDAASVSARPPRPSKFLEGSMNQRSMAVASSWPEYNSEEDGGTDTDSDATPRQSQHAASTDAVDDVESVPTTPATAKRGFLRFRKNGPSNGDGVDRQEASPKKAKKGLRKSLSSWNMHVLGESMKTKMFGGSTTDLTANAKTAETNTNEAPFVHKNDKPDVQVERKRKAAVVYEAQFGLKKQKSNFGLPTSEQGSIDRRSVTPTSNLKNRRRNSGGHTFTVNTASRRRPVPQGTVATAPSSEYLTDTDLRKRPSRRDLEKENQQLRELLRESQSQHCMRSTFAHFSQNLAHHSQENPAVVSTGKNVPPIPSLRGHNASVERHVLGDISDKTRRVLELTKPKSQRGRCLQPSPVDLDISKRAPPEHQPGNSPPENLACVQNPTISQHLEFANSAPGLHYDYGFQEGKIFRRLSPSLTAEEHALAVRDRRLGIALGSDMQQHLDHRTSLPGVPGFQLQIDNSMSNPSELDELAKAGHFDRLNDGQVFRKQKVFAIAEENEEVTVEAHSELSAVQGLNPGSRPQQRWEWPEDVF